MFPLHRLGWLSLLIFCAPALRWRLPVPYNGPSPRFVNSAHFLSCPIWSHLQRSAFSSNYIHRISIRRYCHSDCIGCEGKYLCRYSERVAFSRFPCRCNNRLIEYQLVIVQARSKVATLVFWHGRILTKRWYVIIDDREEFRAIFWSNFWTLIFLSDFQILKFFLYFKKGVKILHKL